MLDHDRTSLPYTLRPRYCLSSDDELLLTAELLNERAFNVPTDHRYLAIEVIGMSKYADLGRNIERKVFDASFGNGAQKMSQEYGPYEAASKFFISIDRATGKPTGVLRVVGNSPQGLKTLIDAQEEPFNISMEDVVKQHALEDLDRVWDIATVAVLAQYRSGTGSISVQLYRAMFKSAHDNEIEHFVSVIDDKLLRKLKGYLGTPFVPLAHSNSGPYLGSQNSHAVYGSVIAFDKKLQRQFWTLRGLLAKSAVLRLKGSDDASIILISVPGEQVGSPNLTGQTDREAST